MQHDRRSRQRAKADDAPLDIVALALAVWLGTMTAVACLVRAAEHHPVNPVSFDASAAYIE